MEKIIKEKLIELIAFLYDYKEEDKDRIGEEETYQKIEAAFLREAHWGFGSRHREILFALFGLATGEKPPIEKCAQKYGLTKEKATNIMNTMIAYLRHPGIKRRIVNSEERKREVYAVYGMHRDDFCDPEDWAPVDFLEVFSSLDEAMLYFKQKCLEIARSKWYAEAFAGSTDEEVLRGNHKDIPREQRMKTKYFSFCDDHNPNGFYSAYWQMFGYEDTPRDADVLPAVWIKRNHLYDEADEVPPHPTWFKNTPYFVDN